MSQPLPPLFHCPNCRATYEVVRIEAPPGPTTDCEIMCVSCGGPLYGRQAKFVLKYFLIERGPSRNLKALTARRFPPPWFIEDVGGSFVVKASNDRPPIFIYYRDGIGRRSLTKLLTRNAARRIAVGIAKLPELLRKA